MKEMSEIPLGGIEPDAEVGKEAERAVAEEEAAQSERERIEQAMTEEGFVSYEERRKKREGGPGRKAARALLEKMRREGEEKEAGKKETLF